MRVSRLHDIVLRSAFALGAAFATGCATGYIETADLERENQGPAACQSRCSELGMDMGALVLVSDSMPACVCEPRPTSGGATLGGAAGASGGEVVIAAAAVQAQQQIRQRQAAAQAAR